MMPARKKRRRRSKFKKAKSVLLAPFYSFASSFSGVLDCIFELIGIHRDPHHSKPKKRRNRDFERAGREQSSPPSIDPKSASELRNAARVRDKEVIAAARKQHRMLAGKSKEAQQAKAELVEEKQSVSKGTVVSHLAKMSRQENSKAENRQSDASE